MSDKPSHPERPLEEYYDYLHFLARTWLGQWGERRIDPADVVHETILKALKNRDQYRGGPVEAKWVVWLRRILQRTLIDLVGKHGEVEQSSCRLESWLAADHTSPSMRAAREELLRRMADSLARLPQDQRIALELRYLREPRCSLADIAAHLGRTEKAAAGLLCRGLDALRDALADRP
ncbi:MAG TPA: sigma-70 family RNA polymerase sigma factor [Gemmataceae bacterium]|jgi:RNA polymerase sigma-70 factor (ECF subfamily)